ncbi:MAG TPA: agmatinase [Gemmatimonadales bacterium]|nr:agmatinase [Gemmatimonadales bacterium]
MIPTLLGIPYDDGSSFQRGPAQAPVAIRAALHSPSTNGWNEECVEVAGVADAGDLSFDGPGDPYEVITGGVDALFRRGALPILLGGDHAITWPILQAVRRYAPTLTILHLDAHNDLYPDFEHNPRSHASPFARILEQGLCDRLVQVGIRCPSGPQQAYVEKYGVEVVPMRAGFAAMRERVASLTGPLYLSLDLDVLDPAFAPGISHPEPGGLTTRELITLIQAIPQGVLVAADIVELNPVNDLGDLTARVAAKCVKEILGRL